MVKYGREPCQVILNPLLCKPKHFCRASSRYPRVGQHRLGNLPRSIGQAVRQQENLSCFLDSFLTSFLTSLLTSRFVFFGSFLTSLSRFFGSLAPDGMDNRPVPHVDRCLRQNCPRTVVRIAQGKW